MADTQTTVALNIGSQRISMAVFEASKNGGLILKAYDSESIVADPALEASRIAQTRVAIGDLAQRLKVEKSKTRYAISGQAVFTRFVKLPPLQDDNLEQLVTFEAQQHVPFPLQEVVWDYELIEGGTDKEVVIVAIKGDALDEINGAVNDCGLGTTEVDVAPMAIYNAFRSTYGHPEDTILLIDIGAKTSNLLYIEGKRFFTRSIAIGGTAITAAIAKEYHVSFLEAEHQKISNGLVALGGGHTEQMDEAVAALAMVIRNALSRLPAEIARTTNYYRSQHGGSAPRRVLLAGGGANLPYSLEFFQEKLNLPVEYFNPVLNLAIGKGIDPAIVQREGHLMGELVGLGLRSIGKSEINIDLVPLVVEQARAADLKKPYLISAAAILLAGMGIWAVYQNVAASAAADKARTMTEARDNLAPKTQRIDELLLKETDLRQIAGAYTGIEADHVFWMDLLAEVRGAFASDAVWLTDFEPMNGFDPLRVLGPKTEASKGPNGQAIVRPEFVSNTYGLSSLADIQLQSPEQKTNAKEPTHVTANAVRIKGFWRENPKSQNLVSELLKSLRDKSTCFRFALKDPKDPQRTLDLLDNQNLAKFLLISVSTKSGELAQPFEITLPLTREVTIH
ncbi:MAG: type IV pilus assembly protein PilM [Verrucomicrobia bacterium]|nr:type IV pilus assembly protein PilM [Verrucomicrobiota bacterium]